VDAGQVDTNLEASEFRASACAVSTPPYDSPQMPTRLAPHPEALEVPAAGEHVLVSALPRPRYSARAERLAVADPLR